MLVPAWCGDRRNTSKKLKLNMNGAILFEAKQGASFPP
jgi:hypothetical protein